MGFRQIYITEATKLSSSDKQLNIHRKDKPILSFPIEDLDVVFLEDPNAVVSTRLLTDLSKAGVALLVCGPDYLPASISIPFNGYYKQSEMLDLQIKFLPSKKNKMWETIIKSKISNQMAVLSKTTNQDNVYLLLKDYYSQVKCGDERNMEGLAAKAYFKALFGPSFVRFGDTPITSALNYGYSIFTGLLIRTCAFSGLNGNLGIWHNNMQNANNLACDLVEPFRPIVDCYVFNHLGQLAYPLSKETRRDLINLVNEYVMVENKKYQVSYAMSMLVNDFVEYLKTRDIGCVHMPSFITRDIENNNDGD